MPAPSLFCLARKECIKNIRAITHVGTLEYEKVRPLLFKLDNPEQLREIEKWSPQICGRDEEIWIEFIRRDAPGWENKPLSPSSDRHWYDRYQEAVAQSKAEVANDERVLKATMDEIKNRRLQHTSKQVDAKSMPRLPKMGGMRHSRSEKSAKAGPPQPKTITVSGSGSRIKTLTGRGVMEKARKEAQERSLLQNRLAVPTHKLQQMASRVQHVPPSFIANHQRPAAPPPIDPTIKPAEVFVPKRKRVTREEVVDSEPPSTEDHAQPMKKLKRPNVGLVSSNPSATSSSPTSSPALASLARASTIQPPPGLVNNGPRLKPLAPNDKPVRPPMRTKRPVDIFLPSKRR